METKAREENLEDTLYSEGKHRKRNLNKVIRKICRSKWGTPPPKKSTPFEEDYLIQDKIKKGYILNQKTKGNEREILRYEENRSYQYEEGKLVKLKKIWDKKSFWYKFFIFDIAAGALVHLGLSLFTDVL